MRMVASPSHATHRVPSGATAMVRGCAPVGTSNTFWKPAASIAVIESLSVLTQQTSPAAVGVIVLVLVGFDAVTGRCTVCKIDDALVATPLVTVTCTA